MRTVPCCFTVFLMTLRPTDPVIYLLKLVIVFNFGTFIFSHSVQSLKINMYQGVVSNNWTVKLLKMGSHSKTKLKTVTLETFIVYNVNFVVPEKYLQVAYCINQRLTDSAVPNSSQQSTQQSTLQSSSQLYLTLVHPVERITVWLLQ